MQNLRRTVYNINFNENKGETITNIGYCNANSSFCHSSYETLKFERMINMLSIISFYSIQECNK